METVKLIKEVPIADCHGVPIKEGSVLRSTQDVDDTQGVVDHIIREGDLAYVFNQIGDVGILTAPATHRYTNQYHNYEHIPREEQTYEQRLGSWLQTPYEHDNMFGEGITKEEGIAIEGIMALLPRNPVDYENGPWADTLEDALRFLAKHLTELNKET